MRAKPLLKKEGIAKAAQLVPKCGVYFLLDDKDEVVYVGSSTNIDNRVSGHRTYWAFARATYVLCRPEERDELERRYIRACRPRFNRQKYITSGGSPMRQLLDAATAGEKRALAKLAGTSVNMLEQIAGGHSPNTTSELAARIADARLKMPAHLPPLTREQLSKTCRRCPYARGLPN